MNADIANAARDDLPDWVPEAARHYIAHTIGGLSIRQLAREAGCHASTVLRQVRRFESRRDDPLVDAALHRLSDAAARRTPAATGGEQDGDAARILRRLCEPGAMLAVAQGMDKAVVVRDTETGPGLRTAVVTRDLAEAMALRDWVACEAGEASGRIARYRITAAGRQALVDMMRPASGSGMAEAPARFAPAPATGRGTDAAADRPARRIRYALAESPLLGLARRRGLDGKPFLGPDLVRAGERLREDFELAQLGPRVTQDWDSFLTVPGGGTGPAVPGGSGPAAARDRVAAALADLGPGLGDVALRCCCHLEGLEAAEKRMGWSARSGKIVLRIALQRLRRHYDELGRGGLIG